MTNRTWLKRSCGALGLLACLWPTVASAADPPAPGALSVAAAEEPENRYFLQIGLRLKALTFAGILQLGLIEGHATAFHGLAQIGWESAADRFMGVAQVGLASTVSEKELYAAAQVSLKTNQAREIYALAQVGLRRNIHRPGGGRQLDDEVLWRRAGGRPQRGERLQRGRPGRRRERREK